jgi:hypothetical protein
MALNNTSLPGFFAAMNDSGLQIAWGLAHEASDPATLEVRAVVSAEARKRDITLAPFCKHCAAPLERDSDGVYVDSRPDTASPWDYACPESAGNHEPEED